MRGGRGGVAIYENQGFQVSKPRFRILRKRHGEVGGWILCGACPKICFGVIVLKVLDAEHTILTQMADEFNLLWSEMQNYIAEADADLILSQAN